MSKKPNLLFILCDQQRYDCVGYSGIRPVSTPNIDSIARGGVWFENAYTPIPVCAPARQSLFTGLRPEVHGALWNPGITFPVGELPDDGYYWPRALKASGYKTAMAGKWNVNSRHSPSFYGYDEYLSDGQLNRAIHEKYGSIPYSNGFFGESCPIPLEDSHTHALAKGVIDILERFGTDDPWHIYMDFGEPHLPCRPSAPFDTMYDPRYIPEWGGFRDTFENKPYIHKQQVINWELEGRSWEEWSKTVAMYYGIISQYDDAIGRVLGYLKRTGQLEDTVIIYTCDHGDLCGSHNLIDKHYVMFEDLLHIPAAIRWDGHIVPRRFGGYVHHTLDFAATIHDLFGLEKPDKAHGESLYPALTGQGEWTRDYAVSTYNGQQFGLFTSRSITSGGYKYVWNLTDIDELYDLSGDPYELKNRIYDTELSDTLSSLRHKLYGELERCGDPILGWTKNQLLKGRKI